MGDPSALLAALKDLAHAWDGTWSQGSRSEVIDTVQRIARSAIAAFEAEQKEAKLHKCYMPNCNHICEGDVREPLAAQPTPSSSEPDDFASAERIAQAVLESRWRDPALSTLAREYLRLAGQTKAVPSADDRALINDLRYADQALDHGHIAKVKGTCWRAQERLAALASPVPPVPSAEDEALIASARRVAHAISEKPEQTVCWKLADRLEVLSHQPDRASTLFDAIAHGDSIHRAWLKEAIDNHLVGLPVPPPRAATPIPQDQPDRDAVIEAAATAVRNVAVPGSTGIPVDYTVGFRTAIDAAEENVLRLKSRPVPRRASHDRKTNDSR